MQAGPPARDAWTESKNAPGHKNIAKEASTKFNSIFGELWEANFGLPQLANISRQCINRNKKLPLETRKLRKNSELIFVAFEDLREADFGLES